jgi:predicted GNAT family acetyltransferase
MTDEPSIVREQGRSGGRYVRLLADGTEAELTYVEIRPGVVTITHTGTPRQHRGQGIAAALVARAVQDCKAEGKKVIPACWFAREQFGYHPEWSEILFRNDEAKA